MNFENEYTVEQEVEYLLNKQDRLKKSLERYNGNVSDFEDMRDDFFKRLYHQNQIKELKEVMQVFDKIAYVETDKPDFVFVDVTDIYDAIPVVEEEYDIVEVSDYEEVIEVEETVTPVEESEPEKLSSEDIARVLKASPKRDYLFEQVLKGKNECPLYQEDEDAISIGPVKYHRIQTGESDDSPICKYKEQLFDAFKQHYSSGDVVQNLGIKPIINDANRTIICSWA